MHKKGLFTKTTNLLPLSKSNKKKIVTVVFFSETDHISQCGEAVMAERKEKLPQDLWAAAVS